MKSYNFDSLKFATEGLTGFGFVVFPGRNVYLGHVIGAGAGVQASEGVPENSDRLNREYAEEINARMNEVKREVGITR